MGYRLSIFRQSFFSLVVLGLAIPSLVTALETPSDRVAREAERDLPGLCDRLAYAVTDQQLNLSTNSAIALVCATEAPSLGDATEWLVNGSATLSELPASLSPEQRGEISTALQKDFIEEGSSIFKLVPDIMDFAQGPSWKGAKGIGQKLFGSRDSASHQFTLFLLNVAVRATSDVLKTVGAVAGGLSFKSLGSAVGSGALTVVKAPFQTIGGALTTFHTLARVLRGYVCMMSTDWVASKLPRVNDWISQGYDQRVAEHEKSKANYAKTGTASGFSREEREILLKAEVVQIKRLEGQKAVIASWLNWIPHCVRILGKVCGAAIGYIDLQELAGKGTLGPKSRATADSASLALSGACWYSGAPYACGGLYAAVTEILDAARTGNNSLNQCANGFGWHVDAWAVRQTEALGRWNYGNAGSGLAHQPVRVTESRTGAKLSAMECCACRQRFFKKGWLRDKELGSINRLQAIESDARESFESSSCKHMESKGYYDRGDWFWLASLQRYTGITKPRITEALPSPDYDYYRYTDCRRAIVLGGACFFPTEKSPRVDRQEWNEKDSAIRAEPLRAPLNDPKRPRWLR